MLLVATHVSNGATSSCLPKKKRKKRWATSTTSGGLAIGHVFGSPSKATDACVDGPGSEGLHLVNVSVFSLQQLVLFFNSLNKKTDSQITKAILGIFVLIIKKIIKKC